VIAYLYFTTISNSLLQAQKHKMKNHALEIASSIVTAHMNNTEFNCNLYGSCNIALYDENKTLLFGANIDNIQFEKDDYLEHDSLYVIDKSAQLHLGVKYIVLKDKEFTKMEDLLLQKVILYTILVLIFIGIVGYFLSKLFLRPIAYEREKLDTFIKNTTHELNTPITALLMSIPALKTDTNSSSLERIKISANRISNIYSDLCFLLKNDLDIQDEIVSVNFEEIIKEQIILMEGYIKSKNITVIQKLEILQYDIDKESAQRLIANLLSNALKYSKPNQKVEITIHNNVLTFQDYGIGIKKDVLQNVQKRYFRANKNEGGFGIGLDIVTTITHKYNIDLKIDSVYQSGTIVTLKFLSENFSKKT
jgi:two-component system OmpR family sensor kinase